MSHQGYEGWFPECLICGMGNLRKVVCLDPTCHEQAVGILIEDELEDLLEADGHFWKPCTFGGSNILADAGAWGTYAICAGCWNRYAEKGELPPSKPRRFIDAL